MRNGGIAYFPLDVTLDDKFELIEAEFGLKGFAVVVKLLQRIYGVHGYYCEWTEEVALLFGKGVGLGGNAVSEIVSASVKRGIFNDDLFRKYQILTSRGIQRRYFETVARRKEIEVDDRYLLVNVAHLCKNVSISHKNVDIIGGNVSNSERRKEEERKGEESRGEEDARARDGGEDIGDVATAYLRCGFGALTEGVKDELIAMEDEYGAPWVCEALRRTMLQGKRGLSYPRGILANWRKKGGMDDARAGAAHDAAERKAGGDGQRPKYGETV